MKLAELEKFNPITIQCHDNPDADALASGFGLYTYFKRKGKEVRLIYAGRNRIQKKNLTLMVNELEIPVEYLSDEKEHIKGLLIMVDCQYQMGNATPLTADVIAVVDHHHHAQKEVVALSEIRPNLGSCATLVWQMMQEAGFSFLGENNLGTALYYGLFSDTNQLSEIYNPLDMDMRDNIPFNKSLINLLKNSNLSLEEMEIAGIALIRRIYNDVYRYAIVKARRCDPNILGLISDFLIQVDGIDTCIAFNKQEDEIKFSVRSCVKEVRADELASYLASDMGFGGGHSEKAGGVIYRQIYEEIYPNQDKEAFFDERMTKYFKDCTIIHARDYHPDFDKMQFYRRTELPLGLVRATDVFKAGTPVTLRTLEGDSDMVIVSELRLVLGMKGEVYPYLKENLRKRYLVRKERYKIDSNINDIEYTPTLRNKITGEVKDLKDYAYLCVPNKEITIYATELTSVVKLFPAYNKIDWAHEKAPAIYNMEASQGEEEKYTLGKPGDFLAVSSDDPADVFIVEREIFDRTYEPCDRI